MKKLKKTIGAILLIGIISVGILEPFQARAECDHCTPDLKWICCEGAFFTDEGHKIFWEIPGRKYLIKM